VTDREAAYEHARRRVRALRGFYRHLAIYAVVCTGLVIVNLVFSPGRIWFFWPMGWWGLGVLVHGVSIWSGSIWLGRDWEERKVAELLAREKIRILSTEKQLAEAQLRMLQAQIEPHFLFNTLANVVSLIDTAPAQATDMLEHFIAYLRASLAASRSTQGTVMQEADLLRNYLELLKIRMGPRLAYAIDVDPEFETAPLAPMLLQPVVENALRHGLEPKIEGGCITVRIFGRKGREGRRLVARVEDDGLGFKPGANPGVGLQNLRERLAVLYDGNARLTIEERERGTAVVLDLPIPR
jgi:sensor histidine kinase YesM